MKKTIATAAIISALAGCGPSIPQHQQQAIDQLTLDYIMAYKDAPGSKKCLPPQQLDGRSFTLCGFYDGGPTLLNAGLWELRQEGTSWAAYAANGKAMASQQLFHDPQVNPAEQPPRFDVGKARAMFPQ